MEPYVIKIKKEHIKGLLCYGLRSETKYKTRKKDKDFSGIVYIQNLRHDPLDGNSNQFVALVKSEYYEMQNILIHASIFRRSN